MYVYVYKKKITDSLTHSLIHSFIHTYFARRFANQSTEFRCLTSRSAFHRGLWGACTRVSIAEKKKERERNDIRRKKHTDTYTRARARAREIDACFELSLFTKRERHRFSHSAVLRSPCNQSCLSSSLCLSDPRVQERENGRISNENLYLRERFTKLDGRCFESYARARSVRSVRVARARDSTDSRRGPSIDRSRVN